MDVSVDDFASSSLLCFFNLRIKKHTEKGGIRSRKTSSTNRAFSNAGPDLVQLTAADITAAATYVLLLI